jgi:hypothetical protein
MEHAIKCYKAMSDFMDTCFHFKCDKSNQMSRNKLITLSNATLLRRDVPIREKIKRLTLLKSQSGYNCFQSRFSEPGVALPEELKL